MNKSYKLGVLLLLLGVIIIPKKVLAQDEAFYTECATNQAECLVEWHNGDFIPIPDALRNTIAVDTLRPDDRIYKLERGGLYYLREEIQNNGFHLRLIGDPNPPSEGEDFGFAVIQLASEENGEQNGRILTAGGDVTFKNVWFSGQDDQGRRSAYLPIRINAPGARIVIDNSIFERTNFAMFGFDSGNNKVYITNSIFRNHTNSSQQWEGRGIRFEAGADTLVMENNTFLNFGHTIIQSEATPLSYFRFVHNTVVNVGRTLNTGSQWIEAYIANNLNMNYYWHGEGSADYSGDRDYPYTGYFTVSPLNPAFGLDLSSRIVYTNNGHFRDPDFTAYYADSIRAQPIINSETDSMFTTFNVQEGLGSMHYGNNFEADPGITSYTVAPDGGDYPATSISLDNLVNEMIANMQGLRQNQPSPWNDWTWDPGRDPSFYLGAGFVWPLPENFAYTNTDYLTGGTNGLPLGDLRWQDPSLMADWIANSESYIDDIEALAGAVIELTVVGNQEAEDGTLGGSASTVAFDGFAYLNFESSGFIEWTFEATAIATDLNVTTNMNGNGVRGQRVIVNGVSIKDCLNYGEYIWDAEGGQGGCSNPHIGMATNEWTVTKIENSALHESTVDGLVLVEGTNTIRLEPSWGYQGFAGIDVVEAGSEDVVSSLSPIDAEYSLVQVGGQTEMNGEDVEGLPSGFKSVLLSDDGSTGSTTLGFDAADFDAGMYRVRVFYAAETDADISISVGGSEIDATTLSSTANDFLTKSWNHAGGPISVDVSGAGVNIDFVQIITEKAMGVSNEFDEKPEGFELSQNYPNPFNPSTNINFTIPATSNVQLEVFNLLGQKVATLVDGRRLAGNHTIRFDASNLASGVYFYMLRAGDISLHKKMTLIK